MKRSHDEHGFGVAALLVLLLVGAVVVAAALIVRRHDEPAATVFSGKPQSFITFSRAIAPPDKLGSGPLGQLQTILKDMNPPYLTPVAGYLMPKSDAAVLWGPTAQSSPDRSDASTFVTAFIKSEKAAAVINSLHVDSTYTQAVHDASGPDDAFHCAVASYTETITDLQQGQSASVPAETGICIGGNQNTTVLFNANASDSANIVGPLKTFMNATTLNLR